MITLQLCVQWSVSVPVGCPQHREEQTQTGEPAVEIAPLNPFTYKTCTKKLASFQRYQLMSEYSPWGELLLQSTGQWKLKCGKHTHSKDAIPSITMWLNSDVPSVWPCRGKTEQKASFHLKYIGMMRILNSVVCNTETFRPYNIKILSGVSAAPPLKGSYLWQGDGQLPLQRLLLVAQLSQA